MVRIFNIPFSQSRLSQVTYLLGASGYYSYKYNHQRKNSSYQVGVCHLLSLGMLKHNAWGGLETYIHPVPTQRRMH